MKYLCVYLIIVTLFVLVEKSNRLTEAPKTECIAIIVSLVLYVLPIILFLFQSLCILFFNGG